MIKKIFKSNADAYINWLSCCIFLRQMCVIHTVEWDEPRAQPTRYFMDKLNARVWPVSLDFVSSYRRTDYESEATLLGRARARVVSRHVRYSLKEPSRHISRYDRFACIIHVEVNASLGSEIRKPPVYERLCVWWRIYNRRASSFHLSYITAYVSLWIHALHDTCRDNRGKLDQVSFKINGYM